MKQSSGSVPTPKQKALVINEPSQARLPAERSVRAETGVNVKSSKGKEVLTEEERPLKRMKTKTPAQPSAEISRVEFDGDEILSLYSGDTLILPSIENSVEDVQEEIRGFIPQALKLANVVSVQFNKMAMRIKELEAENAHLKKEIIALQGKTSVDHGKTVAGSSEHARQLQELNDNLQGHKAMIRSLQADLAYETKGTHALVEKIAQLETQLHGEPVVELPSDVRLAHLMRDVDIAKKVFGDDSKEHKAKQVQLDQILRAYAALAEQKAKEVEKAKPKEELDQ